MTTDEVVKAAGFRRMNEENRWHVENWNALLETAAEAAEAVHRSAFDVTSALRHKGRLEEIWWRDRLLSGF